MEIRNGSLQSRGIDIGKGFHKSCKGSGSFFGLPRSFDEFIRSITFGKREYSPYNALGIYGVSSLFSFHHWENDVIVGFSFPKQFDVFDDAVGGFEHIAVNPLKDIICIGGFYQIRTVDVSVAIRFHRKEGSF